MFKNSLRIAFRQLFRNPVFSLINIFGLAIGMAVAMLNGLWIWDELSFDKYHQNYASIAQVTERGVTEDGIHYSQTSLPYPLAMTLKANYARHFRHVVIAADPEETILAARDKRLVRQGRYLDAGAPDMLSLKMLKGTHAGLNHPKSILLSASTAKELFGTAEPIDQVVRMNTKVDVRVTGVYQDLPKNTAFYGTKYLAPFELWTSENPGVKEQGWDNFFLNVFVQLAPGEKFDAVSGLIKNLELDNIKHLTGREEQVARQPEIYLLPMSRWHLYGTWDINDRGPLQQVLVIGLIGTFVLLLACINFVNLSTARAEKRAKEVGVRKTVGSLKHQLISQFFTESLLTVGIAFVLGFVLSALFLPAFNTLASKEILLPWSNWMFWFACVTFMLLTALIAGSYPAFYLSAFEPIRVLKGVVRAGKYATLPRKMLVVLQFTVSVTLIIATIVVYRQLEFAKDRPVGYVRDGLLMVQKKTAEFAGKQALLRQELKNTGMVTEIAESRGTVTNITQWNGGFSLQGKDVICPKGCGTLSVSPEYGQTVGWKVSQGRDFVPGQTADSSGFVVNEAFARLTGLKNPVGETITWSPGWRPAKRFAVLGVVKDMVAMSPYDPTVPTVFFLENYNDWISIRVNPKVSISQALPAIEHVFKRVMPNTPFDYKFADQEYAAKFAAEERTGDLAALFSGLAIVISSLGLFGLASFVAVQRTKEIGIRKVLGASMLSLWGTLSSEFIVLTIIAFLIASPLAVYFLNQWLSTYTYRTEISWWIFAVAAGLVAVITMVTISFQSIRVALMNPVKALATD